MIETFTRNANLLTRYQPALHGSGLPLLTTHVVLDQRGNPTSYVTAELNRGSSWFSLPNHVLLFHGSFESLRALLGGAAIMDGRSQ
ncbi:hypothetical protein [Leeia aquatica]|uniref:Uncharacterized protein n=1 Tax=Leeia aquatica TaxID=2725557 RepID=A0A847SBK5_9NEIS|nr:hypothetical protein [Leeia aquatica]NLR76277.1 hypothetical protein [Leeia aquatica]